MIDVTIYADNTICLSCNENYRLAVDGKPWKLGMVMGRSYGPHTPENVAFFKKYKIAKERLGPSYRHGSRVPSKTEAAPEEIFNDGGVRIRAWATARRQKTANSALTDEQIHDIRAETGKVPQQVYADEYNISRSTVSEIQHYRVWKDR